MTNRSRSFQNSCLIETGLSDFYKITVTVLRSHPSKFGPQIVKWKSYKNYSKEKFWSQINKEQGKFQKTLEPDSFLNICKTALKETVPRKQKYARANNSPFMNKTIPMAIMKWTRLRKNFFKYRCKANKKAYNAQR